MERQINDVCPFDTQPCLYASSEYYTPIPNAVEDATKEEKEMISQLKKQYDKDTFVRWDHILNTLSDRLYNLYISI